MSRKSSSNLPVERWQVHVSYSKEFFPHVSAWLFDSDRFRGLSFKPKVDGMVIAVAKGYFADGGESVCFGSGYDVVLALMSLDAAIQGGNWRIDTPWDPSSGRG